MTRHRVVAAAITGMAVGGFVLAMVLSSGSKVLTVEAEVNVSRAEGPQLEVSVAADPSNRQILLAGSNSLFEATMRVYASADGGRTWSSRPGPPVPADLRGHSTDPAVAIRPDGRQFFGFLAFRTPNADLFHTVLFVSSRSSPHAPWRTVRVDHDGLGNDKPALLVDPGSGRVYVAWTRFHRLAETAVVAVARSDDGGLHWSKPVEVPGVGYQGFAALAVGPAGTLYVSWLEFETGDLAVSLSRDGGRSFADAVTIAHVRPDETVVKRCDPGVKIPAQPNNCVNPSQTLTTTGGGVVLVWGATGPDGTQDIFSRTFDRALRPEGPPFVVAAGGHRSDQFWPVSALDSSTGRLWVCFYDTGADRTRRKAVYSCTFSDDTGKSWHDPVAVASVPSDVSRGSGHPDGDYGDYEGLAAGGGRAYAVWTDARAWKQGLEEIFAATLST